MATPKKRKKRKPFWKDIKFKYRLTITNENTLEEVASLYVSKLNGISILLFVLLGLFLVAALIVSFTPLRNYLPGYMNSEVREQVVNNALRADSLQQVLERQNLYVMNIQDIFRGDVKTDTVQSMDSLTLLREDSLMERTQREADFRKNKHFGTDIAANPGESVLATLDGTVLMSSYTAETGYVIVVQHRQDFVSVYKHCGSLLKAEGDAVKGGEAIALVGNTGTLTTGPHLHFELWHRGRAVNAEQYIVF